MLTHKKCKLYLKTTKEITQISVKKKLFEFIALKTSTPQSKFGSSDYAFGNKGNLGGYYHAHLTSDVSIVYQIKNNALYTYGIFTHDELGTGQPANINRQKSMKQKFDNQVFEDERSAALREVLESQVFDEAQTGDELIAELKSLGLVE